MSGARVTLFVAVAAVKTPQGTLVFSPTREELSFCFFFSPKGSNIYWNICHTFRGDGEVIACWLPGDCSWLLWSLRRGSLKVLFTVTSWLSVDDILWNSRKKIVSTVTREKERENVCECPICVFVCWLVQHQRQREIEGPSR